MSIYETLNVRSRTAPTPSQDLYLNVYSPNSHTNISNLGRIFNFFRNPDNVTVDLSETLPDVYGIPFPEIGDYFDLSLNLNNVDIEPGICIVKNRLVHIEESVNLNMNSSASWITNPPPLPHSFNATLYYYIVVHFDIDLEATSEDDYDNLVSIGFVKDSDFDDIRDESTIIWIIEVTTDGSGNVTNATAMQTHPNPSYSNDFVEIIDGSHIFWSEIDGGPFLPS